jgi:hypothetical protein
MHINTTLIIVSVGLGIFGCQHVSKNHPALVARYETFARTYLRLRWIIVARITAYILDPTYVRPLATMVITAATYITLWRWLQRKMANRKTGPSSRHTVK